MAACYLMGLRSGTGKKSGKWFGILNLLTQNGFGNFVVMDCFCADRDVFDLVVETCALGDAIIVSLNPQDQVIRVELDESLDSLPLKFGD